MPRRSHSLRSFGVLSRKQVVDLAEICAPIDNPWCASFPDTLAADLCRGDVSGHASSRPCAPGTARSSPHGWVHGESGRGVPACSPGLRSTQVPRDGFTACLEKTILFAVPCYGTPEPPRMGSRRVRKSCSRLQPRTTEHPSPQGRVHGESEKVAFAHNPGLRSTHQVFEQDNSVLIC
jgi:hypothetical protein